MLEAADFRSRRMLASFDGFISRVPDAATAAALRRTGRPVADLTCEENSHDWFLRGVRQDNAAIGRLAARHLTDHRFTAFAFCGYDGRRFSDERAGAFRRALGECGFNTITYDCPRSASRDFDNATAGRERLMSAPDAPRLARWLKSLPKPIAVFCANDLRAFQVIRACADQGIDVPNEIAVLGTDNDTLICNFVTPSLSSIDPNAFALGVAAAECLARALEKRPQPRHDKLIPPCDLVTRASTEVYPVSPPWLSDALVFIRRNLSRHLSAADVYAAVSRSHTRVDAAFRSKLKTTVQQEIRTAALTEATRLLKTSDLSIAEIAHRTGFRSPQYFSNVFSAAFGHPPSTLRG